MNHKQILVLTLALTLLAASGCGKKEDGLSGGINTSDTASSQRAGSVSGKIFLKGTLPPPERLSTAADPFCSNVTSGSVRDESVVTDATGGLANVFVYVKDVTGEYPAPKKPVALDQKCCYYSPHVLGVQVNQPFEIRNSDKTLHNIHLVAKNNKALNAGQISGAEPFEIKFDKPEVMMKFICDVHSWMQCYVGVLPHPFFFVTGKDGTYRIKGLPPGNYTLVAWHEKYGESSKKLEVKEGEVKTLDFTFSAP